MKNKKLTLLLLSFFLSISFLVPTTSRAYDSTWSNVGKSIAAAGAAALLGIGGIVAFTSWAFCESDVQLLERANSEYNHSYAKYHDMVYWFEQTYHLHHITASERARVMHDLSESVLYEIGTKIWYLNEKEHTYRSRLRSSIDQLVSCRKKLCKRIYKLESNYDMNARSSSRSSRLRRSSHSSFSSSLLEQMRSIVRMIESFLPHLRLFSDYLEHHRSYFALYEADGTVRNGYQTELNIIDQYRYDSYQLALELKRCVMSKQYGAYPYIKYVYDIERNIRNVKSCMRRLAYNYSERLDWARQLVDSLAYVKGVIASDPLYAQELRDQERERLEREHIAAMNERTRAEREKTRAMREHNYLLEREISRKEREYFDVSGGCDTEISAQVTINL